MELIKNLSLLAKKTGFPGFLFLSVLLLVQPVNAARGIPFTPEIPLGLDEDAFHVTEGNPLTMEKVALGWVLFFDKRLSKDDTISCSSCHLPEKGFTDGKPVSAGIKGQLGGRSAPTAINRAYSKAQFWDGRAATLEDQSIAPFINPIEHGFANHDELVAKINAIAGYKKIFNDIFDGEITKEKIGMAIASFQRTIQSGNSAFDRYDVGGKENALSASAQRGLTLFRNKARCTKCHSGFNFTDEKFHNLGIGMEADTPDTGRFEVTKDKQDTGAFKTPTLREITRTAPYMHDGLFNTLEEVVDFYNKGGFRNPFLDELIIPLELTDAEKKDLITFLGNLEGRGGKRIKAPLKFPK